MPLLGPHPCVLVTLLILLMPVQQATWAKLDLEGNSKAWWLPGSDPQTWWNQGLNQGFHVSVWSILRSEMPALASVTLQRECLHVPKYVFIGWMTAVCHRCCWLEKVYRHVVCIRHTWPLDADCSQWGKPRFPQGARSSDLTGEVGLHPCLVWWSRSSHTISYQNLGLGMLYYIAYFEHSEQILWALFVLSKRTAHCLKSGKK